jgi:hypothetical protein
MADGSRGRMLKCAKGAMERRELEDNIDLKDVD